MLKDWRQGMARRNRVLVIDPSEVVVKGLSAILEGSTLFSVDAAREIAASQSYDAYDMVIVNPILMPYGVVDVDFFPTTIPVVALQYLPYDESMMFRFDAVISIHEDSDKILRKLSKVIEDFADQDRNQQQDLTAREKEILAAVAKGSTNKEIADSLCISVNTVMTHRKNISKKTGINSISGLTVYAIMNKLVGLNDLNQ